MAQPPTCNTFDSCHMLTAEQSTYDNFVFPLLETNKKTCHMLTAEPSTYDNFLFPLLETNRKTCHMLMAQSSTFPFFFKNAIMSYVDRSAINI